MYELDHMLNGSGSRRHLEDRIRQAQQDKFAHDVKIAQARHIAISPLRAMLIAVINRIIG